MTPPRIDSAPSAATRILSTQHAAADACLPFELTITVASGKQTFPERRKLSEGSNDVELCRVLNRTLVLPRMRCWCSQDRCVT